MVTVALLHRAVAGVNEAWKPPPLLPPSQSDCYGGRAKNTSDTKTGKGNTLQKCSVETKQSVALGELHSGTPSHVTETPDGVKMNCPGSRSGPVVFLAPTVVRIVDCRTDPFDFRKLGGNQTTLWCIAK